MQLSNVGVQKGADVLSKNTKEGLFATGGRIARTEGLITLYKGLSASLLRQATYTTTRIGLYLYLKDTFSSKSTPLPVYMKVLYEFSSK